MADRRRLLGWVDIAAAAALLGIAVVEAVALVWLTGRVVARRDLRG